MTIADIGHADWYTEDGDTSYLAQVLRHEPVELSLDDSVRLGIVLVAYFRAAILSILAGLVTGIVTEIAASSIPFPLLSLVVIGVYLLVFFRSKLNEPIAEWKVLLAGRAHAADSVYSTISGVIRDRRLPVRVKPRRMVNDLATRTVANRLIIVDGTYTVFVSVFPFGTSLYLSWSMWRRRSGWQLATRWFTDIIGSLFGTTDIVRVMLRTDRPRAVREAVHSASREGLKVAVNGTVVPVSFGFPQGLPQVEGYQQRTELHSAPVPEAASAQPTVLPPSVQPPTWPSSDQPPEPLDGTGPATAW